MQVEAGQMVEKEWILSKLAASILAFKHSLNNRVFSSSREQSSSIIKHRKMETLNKARRGSPPKR
jgi:hypothetical protein